MIRRQAPHRGRPVSRACLAATVLPLTLALSLALTLAASPPARAQNVPTMPGDKPPQSYSMIPGASSDKFVEGKYDKNGIYIPPHYQPKQKPAFHGYFFKKKPADRDKKQFGDPAGGSPDGS